MSFDVGENIGPYRVVEKLGQGGMATVFKAYHASLDRYVAIKALHPAFHQDESFAARFQREARVVARLEHRHIVPIYDYAEHEGRPYLVMKFIEGDTLKARLDQGPLSADEINKMVDAIGSALGYAHQQGILHRDIKPSNVLLAKDGQIYLADFGLARIAQSGESTLSSDMVMGTPQYISPEQAMGRSDLDRRTDLYSFGVMLYEMVVGRVPFNADTPFAIIHDHIYSPLPLPHTVNPNVPEQVERVLLKALAKERDDRFEDANKLVAAFKEAWHEAGVPMQGTFIRVSQALKQADLPAVKEVPSKPTPPKGEEKPQVAVAGNGSEAKRSDSSIWMWVSIGLAVLVCVGLLVIVRSNRLVAALVKSRNNQNPPAVIATVTLINPPTAVVNVVANTPPPPPPTQPAANVDADTYLNNALDAWRNHDLQRSMDELNQAVTLKTDQTDFLIEAGTQMFDAQQYIGAAFAYVHAAQNFKTGQQPLPREMHDRLEQSFYFGAAMDDFPKYLPFDVTKQNDPPLGTMAEARYALLHGNPDLAHRDLDQVLHMQPDWPVAQLVNAEILLHDGKKLEARRILQDLSQSPRAPDWVKEQAGILLSKSQ
jgi:serine/threonine protein kinase